MEQVSERVIAPNYLLLPVSLTERDCEPALSPPLEEPTEAEEVVEDEDWFSLGDLISLDGLLPFEELLLLNIRNSLAICCHDGEL